MMRSISFAVLVLIVSSGSAIAQSGGPIRHQSADIPEDKVLSPDEKRRIMYQFATCTARRWRSGVERFLTMEPGSSKSAEMANRLSSSECLISGTLRFDEKIYRAAVYDALYRIDFGSGGPTDFSSVPAIFSEPRSGGSATADDTDMTLRWLAECTVRRGPVEARNLIMSTIGRPDENLKFREVMPMISTCFTNDITLRLHKMIVRGFIGEALYKLSVAARDRPNAK